MNLTPRTWLVFSVTFALAACASAPERDPSADVPKDGAQSSTAKNAPVSSAQEGLMRGDEAWGRGNLDLALYLFVQALEFDDRNAQLMAKIGAIHESRGNLPLARKAFELAHEYDPDDARLSERLGMLLIAQGQFPAAQEALRAADRTAPGRWRTLDGLGQLALRNAAYQQAFVYFERARLASPRTASVLLHRGETYLLMRNDAAAERDARLALSLAGDKMPEAWQCLGRAQANQKKYDQALESFARMGDLAFAYNAVGEVAMKNSDDRLAREYLEKAAQSSPVYYEAAYRNLALVSEKLRRAGT